MVPYGSTRPRNSEQEKIDDMKEWADDTATTGCAAMIWLIVAALCIVGLWKVFELIVEIL